MGKCWLALGDYGGHRGTCLQGIPVGSYGWGRGGLACSSRGSLAWWQPGGLASPWPRSFRIETGGLVKVEEPQL